MGLTGLSCARYFSNRGLSFCVVDNRENPALRGTFDKEFPLNEKYCGEFSEDLFSGNDFLVVSPGVALTEPAIEKALQSGAELSSDIELFVDEIDGPVVAITGSNGKSTVTMLVADICKSALKKVCMAGNIGLPVLDQLLTGEVFDVYVLELSSFQLERLKSLSAKVAAILNVTEDHMDRYNSFQDYLEAKQKIFIGAENIIVNLDDPLTKAEMHQGVSRFSYGLLQPEVGNFGVVNDDKDEWIVFGDQRLISTSELKIRGRHNISNVMAAFAIGRSLNIEWEPMLDAVRSFRGLRHRCEWVAQYNGVDFYNDSKATNVGATVAAINGFSGKETKGHLILIAGGLDKDSDFSPMAKAVREKVQKVFLIGKDAKKIELAIGSEFCSLSKDLPAAVNDAYKYAEKGDVVLFAPACASFDMFSSYEERGDAFVSAVKALAR